MPFRRRLDREELPDVEDVGGVGRPVGLDYRVELSCLSPLGFSEVTLMPYFFVKSFMIVP